MLLQYFQGLATETREDDDKDDDRGLRLLRLFVKTYMYVCMYRPTFWIYLHRILLCFDKKIKLFGPYLEKSNKKQQQ